MKRILICMLAICLLLCGCAEEESSGRRKKKKETEPTETSTVVLAEDTVPDFTVYTPEGTEVKLSDYFGKPIVLNFWASWCGPCTAEMPELQAAYEKLGDKVTFLMVNLTTGDRKADAEQLIRDTGYTFPVYYDTDGNAAIAYEISSIPATYFIKSDGSLAASQVGMLDEAQLEGYLEQILE